MLIDLLGIIMLITNRNKPLLAINNITCFKVMVKWKNAYFVCPPAFQYFLVNKINLESYYLNKIYQTKITNPETDYRIDGVIWKWFYHTFCDITSAQKFVIYLTDKINNPDLELYQIPPGAELVILKAIIPKSALYYQWKYKELGGMKTYASNKILYSVLSLSS